MLMDNQVHLLTTPSEFGAVSRPMQKPGCGHIGQFNARHRRTATLWEGRCKASLVDSESHALHRQRHIDLNPVRARMTDDPAGYAWSSYANRCGQHPDAILAPHPTHSALAAEPGDRAEAQATLLCETLSADDLTAIRT